MKTVLTAFLALALLLVASSDAEASVKQQRAWAMQGYKAIVSFQKQATQRLEADSGTLDYVRGEGECASPIVKELDEAMMLGAEDSAITTSLIPADAFAVQVNSAFAARAASALRLASMTNGNAATRKALLSQARQIEIMLDAPSSSSCSLLQTWQGQGYTGLNELVDSAYGEMALQNSYNNLFKETFPLQTVTVFKLARLVGKNRAWAMVDMIFYRAEIEWYKGADIG